MFVVIQHDAESAARYACALVCSILNENRRCVLGLAAGSTPLKLYRELIKGYRKKDIDFSDTITFNLDEYAGLSPYDPLSFRHFMKVHFFDFVNVKKQHIHFLSGIPQDISRHCRDYEDAIQAAGGITLQILGLGVNGHIGFNEPGSSLASRTRMTALTRETINYNKRFFEHKTVPRCALTMGVGTIREAKKILLIATGREKAQALAWIVEGPVTALRTASSLQLHPDVTVVCDEKAARKLRYKQYYRRAFRNHQPAGIADSSVAHDTGQNSGGGKKHEGSGCSCPS
jgi:glucosamine-6-phosphate deaminase